MNKSKIKNITNNAFYRKINDGSVGSSTYHKKDNTSKTLRAKLKQNLKNLLNKEK